MSILEERAGGLHREIDRLWWELKQIDPSAVNASAALVDIQRTIRELSKVIEDLGGPPAVPRV
jgi:hypothetical protein